MKKLLYKLKKSLVNSLNPNPVKEDHACYNRCLDEKLVDVFCEVFGQHHRERLKPETNMNHIEEWDSQSYIDLILSLEDAYQISFTDSEASQMFQLGHIQRILTNSKMDLPHDDVTHACCQLKLLNDAPSDQFKVVILSGSSARESFLTPNEGLELLRKKSESDHIGWYNLSISGLVAAETLLLLENITQYQNTILVVGYSPIILGGCGEKEFRRSANHERFPFVSPEMDRILSGYGYLSERGEDAPLIPLDVWVERYLKNKKLNELHYDPYLYPTLAPWDDEKYHDEETLLRFYNNSVLNYQESIEINIRIFEKIIEYSQEKGLPFALLELTLHSETCNYLENLGNIVSRSNSVLEELCNNHNIKYIEAVKNAGITDHDFRDAAHIYQKRKEYTSAVIEDVLRIKLP